MILQTSKKEPKAHYLLVETAPDCDGFLTKPHSATTATFFPSGLVVNVKWAVSVSDLSIPAYLTKRLAEIAVK
jgi:hypothetical protein